MLQLKRESCGECACCLILPDAAAAVAVPVAVAFSFVSSKSHAATVAAAVAVDAAAEDMVVYVAQFMCVVGSTNRNEKAKSILVQLSPIYRVKEQESLFL
jgi:hypothetical protein